MYRPRIIDTTFNEDLHCVKLDLLQVSQDGKSLLDKLQRPLTPGSADSLMASANYSKAVHHVLDIIHEVLHHQRQLENIWQHRKVRLHQRLQLCVFQQDVQQVRDVYIKSKVQPQDPRLCGHQQV